jgi:ribosomal protein L24
VAKYNEGIAGVGSRVRVLVGKHKNKLGTITAIAGDLIQIQLDNLKPTRGLITTNRWPDKRTRDRSWELLEANEAKYDELKTGDSVLMTSGPYKGKRGDIVGSSGHGTMIGFNVEWWDGDGFDDGINLHYIDMVKISPKTGKPVKTRTEQLISMVAGGADPSKVLSEKEYEIPHADRQQILRDARERGGKQISVSVPVVSPSSRVDFGYLNARMGFRFGDRTDAEEFATYVSEELGWKVDENGKVVYVLPEKF